jgi:hypothetical protein
MSEIKINITLKEVNNLRLPQIEVDSEDEGAYRAAGKGIEKKVNDYKAKLIEIGYKKENQNTLLLAFAMTALDYAVHLKKEREEGEKLMEDFKVLNDSIKDLLA